MLDLEDSGDRLEADQRSQCARDTLLPEMARRSYLAAEAAKHLFVEDRRRTPHCAFIDDEAHGVGADVDDAHRLELALAPELGDLARHARVRLSSAIDLGPS
jgi:hypothetical protein